MSRVHSAHARGLRYFPGSACLNRIKGLKVRSALDRALQDCHQKYSGECAPSKRANSDLPNICQSVSGISFCSLLSMLSTAGQNSSMHAWHDHAKLVSIRAKAATVRTEEDDKARCRKRNTYALHRSAHQLKRSTRKHVADYAVQADIQIAECICCSMMRHCHLACQAVIGLS